MAKIDEIQQQKQSTIFLSFWVLQSKNKQLFEKKNFHINTKDIDSMPQRLKLNSATLYVYALAQNEKKLENYSIKSCIEIEMWVVGPFKFI